MNKDQWQGPNGRLISMRAALRRIGCGKDTLYGLIAAGELEDFRFTDAGWHWILERSIDAYLKRRSRKGPKQAAKKTTSAKRSKKR